MILSLKLKNIILIEQTEITFSKGLNIITGETGAGKSAIMHAIDSILGARADSSLIRKGAESAEIEALFDLPDTSPVFSLLEDAGIKTDPSEPLIIKRALSQNGKSRLWIQGQNAPLSLLQTLAPHLAELIGQGAYHTLKSKQAQLALLDTFGNHNLTPYKDAFAHLQKLKNTPPPNIADLEEELDAINSLNLQDDEETSLFQEHSRMANSQEISESGQLLNEGLTETLTHLANLSRTCMRLITLDSTLEETSNSIHCATTELQEANLHLTRYLQQLEFTPTRFTQIEERLSAIDTLKRKLGCDFNQLQKHAQNLQSQIENARNHTQDLQDAQTALQTQAALLTDLRTKSAQNLAKALTSTIRDLNMKKAQITINLTKTEPTSMGQDLITLSLCANPGESAIPIESNASGGELSRILLALKLLLSSQTPTLIFDEIDSNIGGQTATLIGEKLHHLGRSHQVICITHFSQVARHGDHHLQITKTQNQDRTLTQITPLSPTERERELLRMLGHHTGV